SGQRAARLTQQLLAFSRKQIIRQELLDLNREVDDTRKMLGRLLGEDIEIEINHGKDLWPIKADRSQLEQVVLNLAVNARDAMPSGGMLTIETANVSLDEAYMKTHYNITPGDYVMLAVSDNGQGMDEETRENIFDPFFTTKEKGKGTGLGLATIYGITKQNNGEIEVYSELGQGTTFKIYLPRADEPIEKIKDVLSVEDISDNRGTETIMLVEDDETVRKMCVYILKDCGYTVLEAENGEDALQVYSRFQGKVDLLLTDVVMPKMNGPDLSEKMQELCPEIKVLFMSGYTGNAIVKHGILADSVNFIHKPVTPKSLSLAVRKILD
ncbi:MAG: response regulator, partial [Desulfobulbaceae bacterium]|nr:response regulator [Desulfobulbaceae bacterium]